MKARQIAKSLFKSFRARVTLILILSLFFVTALSNFLIYRFSLNAQFNQLRKQLMAVAQTAALTIDTDLLLQVPLDPSGINSAQFKSISDTLNKIKEANPPVKSVYTLTKTDKEGVLRFIVDPEAPDVEEGEATAFPGDKYNASRFPEMLKGFEGASADNALVIDEWGVTLSGYAPLRDKTGTPVAIIGVDFSAEDVYSTQKAVHRRAAFVLLTGILACLGLGLLASKMITDPIERLVIGTRHLAAEDLDFKVDIKGNDEISELAKSFNKMANSLSESRGKLHDYFYRVVQSLIRILEAKDIYTRGHSERVAEYAHKAALAMGFTPERAELLRKAAELHDIGKLVIHENILNKNGKLTDEEWLIIQEHPVVGEEILKPVLLDKEMLSIVRSHHERLDGNGYPDKISGDSISSIVQIISVADAYDAMTSARAYRPAFSQDHAIEELKNNCGSQFNPSVVEVFLKVLKTLP